MRKKLAHAAQYVSVLALSLTCAACSPRVIERVRVQQVLVPTPIACPAANDLPAKPDKPALPDDVAAALRVAVAHAARLSGWGGDLEGRLRACQVSGGR